MLDKVSRGKVKKPHLILLMGTDGVGKSTFGSQAPNPIFLGSEDGTNNMDVARFPETNSWKEVETAIAELLTKPHDYKTLVIDSADWLEPILHQEICTRHGAKSIELAAGGYGKGYVEAVGDWQKLCKSLSQLRDKRGMNVIIIAHTQVVKFADPYTQTEYDRYELKLYKKSSALLREFVDCVFFANFEIFSKKDGQKQRHYGDGARVMYTERRPGFDAKNRLGLPFQIPLSWDDFLAAIPDKPSTESIISSINGLLEEVKDADLKAKVEAAVLSAKDNAEQLDAIKNRLIVRLG